MEPRIIARVSESPAEAKTKHFRGFPPELTDGADRREQMERPMILLIEQKPEGAFLFRYTADGRCVGDTWHSTVDEAKHQASFEFEDSISAWVPVPSGVEDAFAFALSHE